MADNCRRMLELLVKYAKVDQTKCAKKLMSYKLSWIATLMTWRRKELQNIERK